MPHLIHLCESQTQPIEFLISNPKEIKINRKDETQWILMMIKIFDKINLDIFVSQNNW